MKKKLWSSLLMIKIKTVLVVSVQIQAARDAHSLTLSLDSLNSGAPLAWPLLIGEPHHMRPRWQLKSIGTFLPFRSVNWDDCVIFINPCKLASESSAEVSAIITLWAFDQLWVCCLVMIEQDVTVDNYSINYINDNCLVVFHYLT